MEKYIEKAKILIEALPYIQKLNNKSVVIKFGGNAILKGMDLKDEATTRDRHEQIGGHRAWSVE